MGDRTFSVAEAITSNAASNLPHLFPKWLKVFVIPRHLFDLLRVGHGYGFCQPFPRFIQVAQLAGVTGQVVTDGPVVRKKVGGRFKQFPCFPGVL